MLSMPTPHHTTPDMPPQAVALFDGRPFFEKALQHGVRHGIIGPEKLAAMCQEAPKGMVQIARYFGTEYLRPDLERARDRLINLVSLYLEHSTGGDLDQAAQSLRDHSLLSRSKGGSDMLKALIAMPQSSHFGMQAHGVFENKHIPLLAKWSLRSLHEYHAERTARSHATTLVEAAVWMAAQLGLDADDLEDAGRDAEAVIRTALLMRACRRSTMPDWATFEKMVVGLRKKYAPRADDQATPVPMSLPRDLPASYREVVQSVQASVMQDMPRILDATLHVYKLFDQTPAFLGRYFWLEDTMADLDHLERSNSVLVGEGHRGPHRRQFAVDTVPAHRHARQTHHATHQEDRSQPAQEDPDIGPRYRSAPAVRAAARPRSAAGRLPAPVERLRRRGRAPSAQRPGASHRGCAGAAAPRVQYRRVGQKRRRRWTVSGVAPSRGTCRAREVCAGPRAASHSIPSTSSATRLAPAADGEPISA
jgi:hypothetical protein